MAGTLARCIVLVFVFACASGCAFDPVIHDPTGSGSGILARCHVPDALRPDLRLCIDFENQSPVRDSSGLDHDAVQSGTIVMEPRDVGEQAAKFALASLHVGETDDLDLNELTVEMFVAITAVPLHGQRFTLLDNSGQYAVSIEDNLEVRCALSGDRHINSGTKSRPGRLTRLAHWYHVACTFDGQSLEVFLDGDTSDCEPQTQPITDFIGGTTIGASSGATFPDYLTGDLDNVHVFARALTHTEICAASGRSSCNLDCPVSDGSD